MVIDQSIKVEFILLLEWREKPREGINRADNAHLAVYPLLQ